METKKNNPFNITFGEEPENFIPRQAAIDQITASFDSDNPETKVYIITGPRGSGKTVLLTHIKNIYENKKDWITVNLNPYGDMVEQLCASVYEKGKVKHLFLKTEFSFSFKGIGFSIQGDTPVSNVETLSEKIMAYLKKKGIKILVAIDDVVKNDNTQYFIHAYQSYIREKYNLYLLMTGLYENISNLENDKGLTFFVRAPKLYLEKLSQIAIANSYQRLLDVDKETSIQLSKITMGYAYGYQLLGNLLYKNNRILNQELLETYDLTLEDNVYSLIWNNLSKKDKTILIAIAEGHTSVNEILSATGINNSTLQVYKTRLAKAGLIDIQTRGQITLSLPRLKEYVLMKKEFEDD